MNTATTDLPLSARRLLIQMFEPNTLRELASLMEAGQPGLRARRDLRRESIDELATMLADGRTPTIGWWWRHTGEAR